MKVKWLGHASFLITSEEGTRIITDPYATGMGISYGDIKENADIVTVSHDHGDHNNAAAVSGNPEVVKGAGVQEAKGIQFKGIASHHDDTEGSQRGPNTIFCFTVDGLNLCHLGDLGHQLSDEQAAEIGDLDILMTPVGGFFTIDAAVATDIVEKLQPRVVIPMHYSTDKCAYPISGVDDFLKGKADAKRMDAAEAEFSKSDLPSPTEIVVLKHAL
jgi:L-ascorbate metabolism protein UlaG (beta-lactamase superfamily)